MRRMSNKAQRGNVAEFVPDRCQCGGLFVGGECVDCGSQFKTLPAPAVSAPATVGRIVHYIVATAVSTRELAAIVTGVNDDGTLSLTVFPPDASAFGVQLVRECDSSSPFDAVPGRWRWPIWY